MIRDNELKPCDGLNYYLEEDVAQRYSLEVLKARIEQENEERYGLPLGFSYDNVKHGGLFNASTERCLLITNTEHPSDYFNYCAILRSKGKRGTLQFFYYGHSVLTGKKEQEEARGKNLGGMLLNALVRVDQTKYDEEYQYYADLDRMIDEISR